MEELRQLASLLGTSLNFLEGDSVGKLSLLVGVVAAILAVISIYYARVPVKEAAKIDQQQQERFGFTYVDREACEFALQFYVQPDCSSVDPSGEDDLRALVPSRQAVYQFFDNVFALQSRYKHVIVLAETGMGKTSLLYNLLSRNSKLSRKRRQRMLYIPLGLPGVVEKIAAVDRKNETILLLDAFDEDTEAVRDHRERLTSLMKAATDFKRVIITCRTQFFTRDEEIPKESGVVKMAPRAAGDGGIYLLYKIYLAPFDESQIRKWTRRRFGVMRFLARSKARALINKISELAARPFLLTALPDLLKDRVRVENVYELYSYMVKKWLEREERWIAPGRLQDFSRRVAVDVYLNRERRMAERLPYEELERHFDMSTPDDGWKFKSRSLLNRDSEGNFKFAHRSIMEFVFVEAYLAGDLSCLNSPWTDFMIELFWKAVESSQSERKLVAPIRESIFSGEDLRIAGVFKEGVRLGSFNAWRRSAELLKPGRADQYARIFVRIGYVGESVAICDLGRNRVYILLVNEKMMEGSQVFAVNVSEAEAVRKNWNLNSYLGISNWDMVSDAELMRVSRFMYSRKIFQPQGIRVWGMVDGGRFAAVDIGGASERDVVNLVPTWQERIRADPHLLAGEVKAVQIMAAMTDAEDFFFKAMRNLN